MSHLEKIISYWRDSLLDAQRMGLDGQVFNTPEDYFKVSRFEIVSGQIDQDITHQIFTKFQTSKKPKTPIEHKEVPLIKSKKTSSIEIIIEFSDTATQKDSDSDEEKEISILLCPIRVVSSTNSVKKDSVAPLWIPAKVTLDGELLPDSDNAPWLSRQLLEPTEFKHSIGTLEAFNNFLIEEDRPTQSWNDFWLYCTEMLKQVTEMNWDSFTLDSYTSLTEAFIFLNSTIQGGSRHVLKVYDWLLKNGFSSTNLLERYGSQHDVRILPMLSSQQQTEISSKHLGQMTGKYPLSISQREALCHFFQTGYGDILAINGPPGTGKTTLLQSVVASLWVERAIAQASPPIILAASTNNQAVTNVLDSFGKTDETIDSPLTPRWLPDVVSYGLYLPSKGKVTKFQTVSPDGFGFSSEKENREYVTEAESYFLESCSTFAERPFSILKQATSFVYKELLETVDFLKKAIKYPQISLEVPNLQDLLDEKVRYKAFKLATHYWEGRWLMSVQQLLRQRSEAKFQKEELTQRYSRYAMLTPCFVSTFYMAPRFFSTYEGETFTPNLEMIDLLIVDEAGQVSPEVAGATFALAKRALVVGDMLQIEPVWSIPTVVDKSNLQKHGLLSEKYSISTKTNAQQEIDLKGLSASAGCVMRIAQRASRYQKFEEQRGMYLTEHRRCVKEIINYCNELCYKGQLQPLRKEPLELPLPHMGYLHIQGQSRRISSSLQNEIEAQTIAKWLSEQRNKLEDFYKEKSLEQIVGIVTPFSKQAELIQKELKKQGISGLTVGTVHRLQGAEREVIIFSPVYDSSFKGTFFFDRNVNMLNVAVSRAKDSFLVFGDRQLFKLKNKGTPSGLLAHYLFKSNLNQLPSLNLSSINENASLNNLPTINTEYKAPPPPVKKKLITRLDTSDSYIFYLDVPYPQKDDAKQLGARFDGRKRLWYVPPGYDLQPFKKWFPREIDEDVKFYIFTSDELIAVWTRTYGRPSSVENARLRANSCFLAFVEPSITKAIHKVYKYFRVEDPYMEDEDINMEGCQERINLMEFGIEEVLIAYEHLFYSKTFEKISQQEKKFIINNYIFYVIYLDDDIYDLDTYHLCNKAEKVAMKIRNSYFDND